jgi:hypothetical protein
MKPIFLFFKMNFVSGEVGLCVSFKLSITDNTSPRSQNLLIAYLGYPGNLHFRITFKTFRKKYVLSVKKCELQL